MGQPMSLEVKEIISREEDPPWMPTQANTESQQVDEPSRSTENIDEQCRSGSPAASEAGLTTRRDGFTESDITGEVLKVTYPWEEDQAWKANMVSQQKATEAHPWLLVTDDESQQETHHPWEDNQPRMISQQVDES